MKTRFWILVAIAALAVIPPQAKASSITLGRAGNFAVLAGTTVTNTGLTVINGGDVGVSPGTAITGFAGVDGGPGIITSPYSAVVGGTAVGVQADLLTAYNAAVGLCTLRT